MNTLIDDPNTVLSLGDGGAHCGLICDASLQTFMLTHWVRDRTRGKRIPLEQAVHRMTQSTASLYGLLDRGVVAPGYKADLNLIDFDGLKLHRPEMAYDLPAGARRLLQRADGYQGEDRERPGRDARQRGDRGLPGQLIRGAQGAPS